jgi:hypothetical protein
MDLSVSSVQSSFWTAASNLLPPVLRAKVDANQKSTGAVPIMAAYASYPDVSFSNVASRCINTLLLARPVAWDESTGRVLAAVPGSGCNIASPGIVDAVHLSGTRTTWTNTMAVSSLLTNHGPGATFIVSPANNVYSLVSASTAPAFFSMVSAWDGMVAYGISNSAFGAPTGCMTTSQFGGTVSSNITVVMSNAALGLVTNKLVVPYSFPNARWYPTPTWNAGAAPARIDCQGGQSYASCNFGVSRAISAFVTAPGGDTANVGVSISANTIAGVPFAVDGITKTLYLSGPPSASGSNNGTLTMCMSNALDPTGSAAACNLAIPYTVYAVPPPSSTASQSVAAGVTSNLSISTPSLFSPATGGVYAYSLAVVGTVPFAHSINSSTGVMTVGSVSTTTTYAYTVNVTSTDQFSQAATSVVTLSNVGTPSVTAFPAVSVNSNISVTLSSWFASTRPLSYSVTGNPRGNASITGGTTLGVTYQNSGTSYSVVVTATDNLVPAQSATNTLAITDASLLTSTPFGSATVSSNSITYTLSTYFTGSSISYSVSSNPYSNASIVGGVLTVTGALRNTAYNVVVTGTSGGTSTTSTLSVTENQAPPVVYGTVSAQVVTTGGGPIYVPAYISNATSYSCSGGWAAMGGGGAYAYINGANRNTQYTVWIYGYNTRFDGGNSLSASTSFTVTENQAAPYVTTAVGVQVVNGGGQIYAPNYFANTSSYGCSGAYAAMSGGVYVNLNGAYRNTQYTVWLYGYNTRFDGANSLSASTSFTVVENQPAPYVISTPSTQSLNFGGHLNLYSIFGGATSYTCSGGWAAVSGTTLNLNAWYHNSAYYVTVIGYNTRYDGGNGLNVSTSFMVSEGVGGSACVDCTGFYTEPGNTAQPGVTIGIVMNTVTGQGTVKTYWTNGAGTQQYANIVATGYYTFYWSEWNGNAQYTGQNGWWDGQFTFTSGTFPNAAWLRPSASSY